MRKYFAHSENDNNERHLLAKHLYHTAKLMEDFSFSDYFKPIFKVTGLLHDLGKYQLAFQDYLESGGDAEVCFMQNGVLVMREDSRLTMYQSLTCRSAYFYGLAGKMCS